jgi:hypothetical protein
MHGLEDVQTGSAWGIASEWRWISIVRQPHCPGDKTIQRILAYLKSVATSVPTPSPFPLEHPMAAITLSALGTGLEEDRALTAAERRRLLDAADLLLVIDALDVAPTEALRRAVRDKSESGRCG